MSPKVRSWNKIGYLSVGNVRDIWVVGCFDQKAEMSFSHGSGGKFLPSLELWGVLQVVYTVWARGKTSCQSYFSSKPKMLLTGNFNVDMGNCSQQQNSGVLMTRSQPSCVVSLSQLRGRTTLRWSLFHQSFVLLCFLHFKIPQISGFIHTCPP